MISVRFQGKPFNITVIQAYAATSNAEEAEVGRFYEDLQDLLESENESEVTQSCVTLCDPVDCSLLGFLCPRDSPGKNTGVGYHFFLQEIFLTQGSNLHLSIGRQVLHH